ncbi:MAG: hypothetical protein HZB16_19480 [Armatimonadetes bacterium]|nr:hypothetical protein [Armatimonadota bacterium]
MATEADNGNVDSGVSPRRGAITWRSVILGLLLIPPNIYWTMQVEGIWHSGHPSALSLFWNVIFTVLVVIVLNMGVKRVAPRLALTQGELIVIYILLYMPTALAGHDSMQLQLPSLALPYYGANDSNKWASLLQPFLPQHLVVSRESVYKPFFEGHSSLLLKDHWKAWVTPVFWWTQFIAAFGLLLISVNVFLRRQWTEHEKLSFPLIQLPLAMTANGGDKAFFGNRLFWIGFAIAASIDLLNGLHGFVPAVPLLRLRHDHYDWGKLFTTFPWNRVGWMPVPLYPFIIALGFFLPLDLSFSIWFFYLFQKAERVASAAANLPNMPELPYVTEQTGGALFVLCLYTLWLARHHLKAVLATILGRPGGLDDSNEPFSYRLAALGMVAGSAFIYYFCRKAGMTPGFIPAFFGVYLVIALAITRMRAELGPPAHELLGVNSMYLLVSLRGVDAIGARNLIMHPLFYWFTGRGYRTQIMPPMMEGFKMAERAGISSRGLGWIMLLGVYVGGIVVYVIGIQLSYTNTSSFNGMTMHNWGQVGQTAAWIEGLAPRDHAMNVPRVVAFVAAMGFTVFLMLMRVVSLRFPFHPAGYALSMTFGVDYFWMCMVIAWAVKSLVLKYGGYKLYRKCLPVCYGLLLGEYVVGAFWSVLSLYLGRPIYDFSPG